MANQNNSNGPKTVPLKMTSSIPLKKETIRVSVKADPLKPPASDAATPPPLPGATKTEPPAIKTVALSSPKPPTPTTLTPDAPRAPAVKTVPLTNSGAVPIPTSIQSGITAPSVTVPLPTAPPVPSAPNAPQPIKTVPLTNSGSVIVSSVGSEKSVAAPIKTVPLASAPPAPIAPTAPIAPASTPNPSAPRPGGILKTQALNAPAAIPAGLKTQNMGALQPPQAVGTKPLPVPSSPVATSPIVSSPVASAPQNTKSARSGTSFKTQKEESNPNKWWPVAAAALFFATVSLVTHILGYTAWN